MIYNLRGFDDDGAFLYFSEGIGSGQGARPTADGLNAIYFRDQRNYPVEFEEGEFPLRIERYAIRPDSGGPGFHRGGCGVVRDVRIMVDCTMSTRMDNVRFPCFGINGGGAGWPGRFLLNPGTVDERELPPAGENIPVKAGDLLRVETGGGGGWGDPFTKPPVAVQRDVLEGFVTVEAALEQYGVALTAGDLKIDADATNTARSAAHVSEPTVDRGPNGHDWLARLGVAE